MIDFALALGQGGGAGGRGAGGFSAFIPLIVLFIVGWIVYRIGYNSGMKKGKEETILQSKCESCGTAYTKGDKFCKKCGNQLD